MAEVSFIRQNNTLVQGIEHSSSIDKKMFVKT